MILSPAAVYTEVRGFMFEMLFAHQLQVRSWWSSHPRRDISAGLRKRRRRCP